MSNSDSERRALKPCPFCGAEVECTELVGIVVIECGTKGCPGNGDSYEPRSVESGIRQWNTRAEDPALSRIRAALNLDEGADVVAEVERMTSLMTVATKLLEDIRKIDCIDKQRGDERSGGYNQCVQQVKSIVVAALAAAKERTE